MNFNVKRGLKNFILFSLLLVIDCRYSFSQQPAGMEGSALWLKGITSEVPGIQTWKSPKELFNFNPIFESKNPQLDYKNILENKYSLFVVFRSDFEKETALIRMKTFDDKIEITNRKAGDITAVNYQNSNPKTGMLLSYVTSSDRKVKPKGNLFSILNLSGSNTPKGQKNELMELLYYPRLLSNTEQKKRETYLSIKYGISLSGESDYLSSDSKKIWDYKENKSYNYRVTGIGRDDFFSLYQKQSGNSALDGLFIGLKNIAVSNQSNVNTLPDKTYLIWGDNNGPVAFKSNGQGDFKAMSRTWKMQNTLANQATDFTTQMILNKKDFQLSLPKAAVGSEEFIWLVISDSGTSGFDYLNARYYKAKEEESRFVFDNVVWDKDKSGSDLFSFIKAPDLFVTYSAVATNCNESKKGKLDIKVVGGIPPFKVGLTASGYNKYITANEKTLQIPEVSVGEYQISVKDDLANTSVHQIMLDSFKGFYANLDSEWLLIGEENKVKLIPTVPIEIDKDLTYNWQYNGLAVSAEKELETNKPGEYKLTITNSHGCESVLTCTVKNSNQKQISNWSLYPNPTEKRQPFTIDFNLEKSSKVDLAIYDISDRLVSSKDLGMIKVFEYTDSLTTSGIYMVVVTINGTKESAKLIIR